MQGETKRYIRDAIIRIWQERWQNETEKGQWTKKLKPDLQKWVKCGHRKTNYFITQALSGHGSFKSYTHRIKKFDPNCNLCFEEDTSEHALFYCRRWTTEKHNLEEALGLKIKAKNLVEKMIMSERAWELCEEYITGIVRVKEVEDRKPKNS